ncbi:MAG TPA: alanyl-tRNA editing protein [Denitromonas sp.]|nr:alanyl-tRNA editing protein [Denitromonas sp.]
MTELVFRDDAYARECDAVVVSAALGRVVLDRSVFYPTGGGQPGDTGVLMQAGGTVIPVLGTVKGEDDTIVHLVDEAANLPAVGTHVTARIDWDRRHRIMRFHTALHLLCAVVAAPVTGGRMSEDKAHLDFDIDMDKLVAEDIESRLNALVSADSAVACGAISDAELDANPGLVKTMSVQPPRGQGSVRTIEIPGVDLQPCGGTHVQQTAEIGALKVIKIRSEGKRNRRVTIAFAE